MVGNSSVLTFMIGFNEVLLVGYVYATEFFNSLACRLYVHYKSGFCRLNKHYVKIKQKVIGGD